MRARGVTGKLPEAKLKEHANRVPLTKSDWRVLSSMIRTWIPLRRVWGMTSSQAEFLTSQGYGAYSIGVANFVCDHCPIRIRAAWKIANLDHNSVLDLLMRHTETEVSEAVEDSLREHLELSSSGICIAALEVAVKDLDAPITASSIADKYIGKPKPRYVLPRNRRN